MAYAGNHVISPCPFCESASATLMEYEEGCWAVACASCGAIGPSADSKEEATTNWEGANRRQAMAAIV